MSAAKSKLDAAGLAPKVREVNVPNAKAGEVVRQTPAPGTEVDEDSIVTLFVATGRVRIPVDKLVGATYDEAAAVLTKLGLTPSKAFAPSDEAAGTVISVDPDTTAKAGATVTLTVANGVPAPPDDKKGEGKGKKEPDKKDTGKKGGKTGPAKPGKTSPSPAPTTTSPTTAEPANP